MGVGLAEGGVCGLTIAGLRLAPREGRQRQGLLDVVSLDRSH
jgi:hypothetical protein